MHTLEVFLMWTQLALLVPLAILGFHRGWLVLLLALRGHRSRRRPEPAPPTDLPRVTVQLPIYNERFVAARLCQAVAALDWPRDRLQVQVLDDSTDDTTEVIARTLPHLPGDLVVQHRHRNDREGFKAGALAAAMPEATGEFIAIFDADFVPEPDFLRRTIPHFADPGIGMVQARWDHRNPDQDRLTEIQANLLDGHFLVEHVARSESGCLFNFNGTAGVFRRTAIADAGGWHSDTLTEDVDLSYRAQLAGWRFRYLPQLACPADLPVEMSAFLNQQQRWATGSIQVARKLLGDVLRSSRFGLVQKVEAVFHLCGNVAFPLLLGFLIVALPLNLVRLFIHSDVPTAVRFAEGMPMLFAMACVLFYYGTARVLASRMTIGSFFRLPLVFSIGAGMCLNNTWAVICGMRRNRGEFVRTPKTQTAGAWIGYRSRRGKLPFLELGLGAWVAANSAVLYASGNLFTGTFFALCTIGLSWTGGRSLREALTPALRPATLTLSSARS